MHDVIVIGGGLAGLTASIVLQKGGKRVLLLEKNEYPFHRVCGEYVSNEVIPFLKENDLWPGELNPVSIDAFQLTDIHGKEMHMSLDLGGFGLSRYAMDQYFAKKAYDLGVDIRTTTRVEEVDFKGDTFLVKTRGGEFTSRLVVGAFGKRSHLDKKLRRPFMEKRSPYLGVKYHIRHAPHERNTVALHNFKGGYCGLNAIEDDLFNLCYLSHRDNLKKYRDIPTMEKEILCENPALESIFRESEFIWESPLVINEISFETKEPVTGHILTCGDAAGMITPLCGNGMAMAIHSGKILAETILRNTLKSKFHRATLENEYRKAWKNHFSLRLSAGRQIQKLFGNPFFSNLAVNIGIHSAPVARFLMRKTHGAPFS